MTSYRSSVCRPRAYALDYPVYRKRMDGAERHTRYNDLCMHFLCHSEQITDVLLSFPSLSVSLRKHVLSLTRIQVQPIPGSRLYEAIRPVRFETVRWKSRSNPRLDTVMTFLDYIHWISDLTDRPVTMALLSVFVRAAPYDDYTTVQQALEQTIEKELIAAVNVYHPVKFDYRVIFDKNPAFRLHSFDPGSNPDPRVAQSLYEDFQRAKERLKYSTLFPDISRKTVGIISACAFRSLYDETGQTFGTDEDSFGGVTTRDIEQLYHETGVESAGPVEVRSAWKYNDLKPRIYYARGGTVYHASKYIQSLFNVIIDELPEVHRLDLFFEPSNMSLTSEDLVIIYDYESFTSWLDEIKRFVEALALFMDDCEVTVIDSRDGPVQTTVGELLRRYNRACNMHAEFDCRRLPGCSEFPILMHTCGMLGVPGNIFSCTILHGIVIRFIAGLRRARSVGDDGKVYTTARIGHTEESVHRDLSSIGRLQQEKMTSFGWVDGEFDIARSSYQFIKRPYSRVENRMLSGINLILPEFASIYQLSDDYHVPIVEETHDTIAKFSKQVTRLYTRIGIEFPTISDAEFSLCIEYVKKLRHRLIERAKKSFRSNADVAARRVCKKIPIMLREEIGLSGYEIMVRRYDLDEPIWVPCPFVEQDVGVGYEGEVWTVAEKGVFSWLEKMQYIQKEKQQYMSITRELFGDASCVEYLSHLYRYEQKYLVIRRIPSWVCTWVMQYM
jgi:hypothetical protein